MLCLNLGVDPPDVAKIKPCATMECWVGAFFDYGFPKVLRLSKEPSRYPTQKALENIARNLQMQYENLAPKV